MNNELLDELIKDLTKAGSIPKSEAKRRLDEYVVSVIKEAMPKRKTFVNKSDFSGMVHLDARDEAMFDQGINHCIDEFKQNLSNLGINL